jgi:hypothetical protein
MGPLVQALFAVELGGVILTGGFRAEVLHYKLRFARTNLITFESGSCMRC